VILSCPWESTDEVWTTHGGNTENFSNITHARDKAGLGELVNQQKFFLAHGKRVRELPRRRGLSQEDMISFGFSARHWQQIEAGRPITVSTLLRICDVFKISAERLVHGLDRGIYRD
jgi:hypothetical protein